MILPEATGCLNDSGVPVACHCIFAECCSVLPGNVNVDGSLKSQGLFLSEKSCPHNSTLTISILGSCKLMKVHTLSHSCIHFYDGLKSILCTVAISRFHGRLCLRKKRAASVCILSE